jgi:hypothetical protein
MLIPCERSPRILSPGVESLLFWWLPHRRFKKAGIAQGLQASALEYDPKQTQFANYKELGLLADANQIGVTRNSRVQVTGFNPRVKGASAAPRPAEETHPLELEVPEGAVTVRRVPPGEVQVLRKLIERHGDDYAAMARDKHNTHQASATHTHQSRPSRCLPHQED